MMPFGPAAPCGSGGSYVSLLGMPSQEAETAANGVGESGCGAGAPHIGTGFELDNRTAGRGALGAGKESWAKPAGTSKNAPTTIRERTPEDRQLANKSFELRCILVGKSINCRPSRRIPV